MPANPAARGDASIQVLIESLLDKHGFEDFKKASDEAVARAQKLKVGLGDAAAGQDKLAGKTRLAKAEVSVFTMRMLQSVGATKEGAIAAHVAGVGYEALAVGLSATSLAFAAGTLAVGLILPKILEFFNSSKGSAEAFKTLKDELYGSLPAMNQYKGALAELTVLQRGLLQIQQDQAMATQRGAIVKNKEQIADLRKQVEGLLGPERKLVSGMDLGEAAHWENAEATKENKKAAAELAITLADLEVTTAALEEADRNNVLLSDAFAGAQERSTEKAKAAAEALERQRRAQEALNDALREGANYIDQGLLQKDSEALADREKQKSLGALTQELFDQLTTIDDMGIARRRLAKEDAELSRQEVKDKRAFDAEMVAGATGSLTALFGKNKAARIAQAIADTYAAANVALATPAPWPAPAIFAALAIATGLANVASIRKSELGFDNPVSDLLAERLGVGFAEDFIRHVQSGFDSRIGSMGGGGGGGVTNNSYTYNSGASIGAFHAEGYYGSSRTSIVRKLSRDLSVFKRKEAQMTIGGRKRLV